MPLKADLRAEGYKVTNEEPDAERGKMFRAVRTFDNGQAHHVFFYETDEADAVLPEILAEGERIASLPAGD